MKICMIGKKILGISLLIIGISACSSPGTTKKKEDNSTHELPNIIMLVGDDQGYPYFGFMGADYLQTPNMDSLAANGVLFTDGYVSDNHCRPSLQTLLTGTLPIDFQKEAFALMDKEIKEKKIPAESVQAFQEDFDKKAYAFAQANTLPKMLAEKGYVSFQGGKWWEFNYQNGGFTHGMTKGWTEGEQKTKDWFIKHMGGDGMDLARVTNQPAYDFLEETKGRPFFMWFAPSLPHYPFDAPEKYYNLYKNKDMSESAKQYYANCTWFDDAWGEMVGYLKEKGLYDNTLIIYVNDNGWEQDPKQEYWNDPMRSHNGGDKGKSSIYDMSFRTPVIFTWGDGKKLAKGVRTNALIHSADIPATVLDYVGLDIPEYYYGRSFKDVIEGEKEGLRDFVQGNVISTRSRDPKEVMGRHVEGYWVRKDNWFLRWHVTDNEVELFDLNNDLRNDHDVSDKHPEAFQELKKLAEDYKIKKGMDPRISYYRRLTGEEK
ncbi:MAG: sulfatase-like hydrolase/transferase [Bacteroidia bacterium]|nr:sulfatase-like hydrolase/transferase [Bacteroidia bacterium]